MATKEDKPTNNDTDNEPKKPEDVNENTSQAEEGATTSENQNAQDTGGDTAEASTDGEPSEAESAKEPEDGEIIEEEDKSTPTQATDEPSDNINEGKVDNKEHGVFYVDGYGNVNGCRTQAEAERKAKKLIEKARR